MNKLVEPRITGHKIAFVTDLVAPRVFNLPLGWLAVDNVNAGEDHRVGHEAFAVIEAFRLGHGEVGVEKIILLIDVGIHDAQLPIGTLSQHQNRTKLIRLP